MGIREVINRKPGIAIGTIALVLIALAVFIFLQFRANHQVMAPVAGDGPKSWYTADDGKSWFPDRANRVTPFDHDGKQAYRCYVWTCDEGKVTFVSHLERLKPSLRAALKGKETFNPIDLIPGSLEVKPPLTGDTGWIDTMSADALNVQTPKCPGGKPGPPQPLRIP
jgi:hypothetical protein